MRPGQRCTCEMPGVLVQSTNLAYRRNQHILKICLKHVSCKMLPIVFVMIRRSTSRWSVIQLHSKVMSDLVFVHSVPTVFRHGISESIGPLSKCLEQNTFDIYFPPMNLL